MTHAEAQDFSGSPLIITGPGTMTQVGTKWPLLLGEAEGQGGIALISRGDLFSELFLDTSLVGVRIPPLTNQDSTPR